MVDGRKIAFIKRGSYSLANQKVQEILETEFSEFGLEIIDIPNDFLRRRPDVVLANVLHLVFLYGWDLVRGRKTFIDAFYNTPFLFSRVKRFLQNRLEANAAQYAFTFQTQSLFDASVTGIPHFIYTDHTNLANLYYPDHGSSRLFGEEWASLEQRIYLNAAKTFTMSRQARRSVIEHYGAEPDRVSCIGAGGNAIMGAQELENDGYSNQRILFIGKDWERKGGPELVEAFKIVLQTHPRARLTIVGCSPRLNLKNCDVLGPQPIETLPGHYARASVFCMPSRVEPLGFVFLEALLSRIPVVANRAGGLTDLINGEVGGLLVEPGKPEKLAEALVLLLSNPVMCRLLGETGHALVKEHYVWEVVGRKLRREIDDVLESQHGAEKKALPVRE